MGYTQAKYPGVCVCVEIVRQTLWRKDLLEYSVTKSGFGWCKHVQFVIANKGCWWSPNSCPTDLENRSLGGPSSGGGHTTHWVHRDAARRELVLSFVSHGNAGFKPASNSSRRHLQSQGTWLKGNDSDLRNGGLLVIYFFKALWTSEECQNHSLGWEGLGQKSGYTTSLAL